MTIRQLLEAIRARIHGEWDNPNLKAWGPVSTDTQTDVDQMAREAIAIAERLSDELRA